MPNFQPTRLMELSRLELDTRNPRLPSRLRGGGEDEIIKYLALKTNLVDLVTSIGENGFFPGEAIVVTPSETVERQGAPKSSDPDERNIEEPGSENSDDRNEGSTADQGGDNGARKYLVLEGNRRFTALKLLQDPELAQEIAPSLGRAVRNAKNRPDTLPVYEVKRRQEALQYLGFRHVAGVQRWDPLAKARYLHMLYREAEGEPESRYAQVASEIGSRRDTVRKNLDALAAYTVVEQKHFFQVPSLSEETFKFGTFYTALADPGIAEFTGARNAISEPTHPIENPEHLDANAIGEIVQWMFAKDSDGVTKLGESRNLSMLGDVVAAPNALKRFREGATLHEAHLQTPDIQNDFIRELRTATTHVASANTKLSSVTGDDPEVKRVLLDLKAALDITTSALGLTEVPST